MTTINLYSGIFSAHFAGITIADGGAQIINYDDDLGPVDTANRPVIGDVKVGFAEGLLLAAIDTKTLQFDLNQDGTLPDAVEDFILKKLNRSAAKRLLSLIEALTGYIAYGGKPLDVAEHERRLRNDAEAGTIIKI